MKYLLLFPLLLIGGCTKITELNDNVNMSTATILQNADTVRQSTEEIRRNAQLIEESTKVMEENHRNLERMKNA